MYSINMMLKKWAAELFVIYNNWSNILGNVNEESILNGLHNIMIGCSDGIRNK